MRHDLAGVEDHRQALSGALRMPDDADAAISTHGLDRAVHGLPDDVELVIAGNLFDDLASGGFEHDEVPDQIEETTLLVHPLQ